VEFILDKYKNDVTVTTDDIKQCIADVVELEKQGKLYSKDVYENLAIDFKNNSNVIKFC
jgi:uncharacterized protein